MATHRNILANYLGNAWIGLMGFVFVPIYLRYIGAEGYGLIGFFATISSVLTILDGGFGAAASRELSKSSDNAQAAVFVRNLVRTLEWLFWGMAVLIGCLFISMSPWLVGNWLNVKTLSPDAAIAAMRLMGATLILQWPTSYYSGCIMGLQKQVGLGVINSVSATLKGLGAVLVLALISPTLEAFFFWQLTIAAATAVATRTYLWRKMPAASAGPSFNLMSLDSVKRFAGGVVGINILALVLTQVDKVILSKILPLEQFGYYILAGTLSALIYRLTGPIFNALYPRITQLVGLGDRGGLVRLYHQACQLMALSIVPFSMMLVFFGRQIVWIWTGNVGLASNIHWVVACLAVGTMLNGLMHIPHGLQLANGWTALAFWQNVVAVAVIAPLTYVLATRYGVLGAAFAWPILNAGYLLFGAPIMYRRLLPDQKWQWYAYSVMLPMLASAFVMGPMAYLFSNLGVGTSKVLAFTTISFAFAVSLGLSVCLLPSIRGRAFQLLRFMFIKKTAEAS